MMYFTFCEGATETLIFGPVGNRLIECFTGDRESKPLEAEAEKVCLQCGEKMKPNSRFCPKCGTGFGGAKPLLYGLPKRFCPNCGKALNEGSRFCTHCGFDVGEPSTPVKKETKMVTQYRVNLCTVGDKLRTIKVICEETGMGLAEAKHLCKRVSEQPYAQTIQTYDTEAKAWAVQTQLQKIGTTTTITKVQVPQE